MPLLLDLHATAPAAVEDLPKTDTPDVAPTGDAGNTWRPGASEQIQRSTRGLLVAFAVFTLLAVSSLLLLADHTDRFFAWPITSRPNSAFLGAAYGAGFVLSVLAVWQRRWSRVREALSLRHHRDAAQQSHRQDQPGRGRVRCLGAPFARSRFSAEAGSGRHSDRGAGKDRDQHRPFRSAPAELVAPPAVFDRGQRGRRSLRRGVVSGKSDLPPAHARCEVVAERRGRLRDWCVSDRTKPET